MICAEKKPTSQEYGFVLRTCILLPPSLRSPLIFGVNFTFVAVFFLLPSFHHFWSRSPRIPQPESGSIFEGAHFL